MQDTGVEVCYALDGYRALGMVKTACDGHKGYNVVILDWKMPGHNGIETAKRIRQSVDEKLLVLVLTSYDYFEVEAEARAAGIEVFLTKPFFKSNFRRALIQHDNTVSDAPQNAESSNKAKSISIAGLKILAAEDNEINAEILVDLLETENVSCEVAVNGQEAVNKLTAAEAGTYDLILMDVQMPVMNGHEATRAIRASSHPQAKGIPIIAMTANAFDDDVKQALDAGMNAHMAKPLNMERMKETITRFINKENK